MHYSISHSMIFRERKRRAGGERPRSRNAPEQAPAASSRAQLPASAPRRPPMPLGSPGQCSVKTFRSWDNEESGQKKNIGFYEKLLPKCKKQNKAEKPAKPQIACQPRRCYYLLFIAIGWVGREEFRAGQMGRSSVHPICPPGTGQGPAPGQEQGQNPTSPTRGQDQAQQHLTWADGTPPNLSSGHKTLLRVWGPEPGPGCPYKAITQRASSTQMAPAKEAPTTPKPSWRTCSCPKSPGDGGEGVTLCLPTRGRARLGAASHHQPARISARRELREGEK